jgi:hypothetical protein
VVDALDGLLSPPEAPPPEYDVPARICQYSGCENVIPATAHGRQIYCEDHKGGRERAPNSVKVQIGASRPSPRGSAKDKQLAAVEARAEQLATTVAALVLLAGQQNDAMAIQNGSKMWAQSVRGVAEYEEWLRKLAAGGETSGRAMAWLQLAIATASIVLPILINHGALPDNIADLASKFLASVPEQPANGPEPQPQPEPEPAAA